MVRFLLIALVAGCYRPSLVDCVDTCSESHLCPSGLSCVGGFCTSGTACLADARGHDSWLVDAELLLDARATDAAVDAMVIADAAVDGPPADAAVDAMPDAMTDAAIDAMADATPIDAPTDAAVDAAVCPPPPTASPCATTNPPPMPPYCFTVCTTASSPMTAANFMSGTWHAAVITDAAEEAAAVAAIGGGSVWIGLIQSNPTVPSDGWHWIMQGPPLPFTAWASGQPDDGDGTESHAEDCGALGPAGWTDESCFTNRPFLIEPF